LKSGFRKEKVGELRNFDLRKLLEARDIVIQCHDIPDADALACAFALSRYIESNGSSARIVYGGNSKITKPNLKKMLEIFGIPAEHVSEIDGVRLLVTVDGQYGAGNVTRFDAERVVVFDHHRPETPETPDSFIRPALGSCATLIWDLMRCAGFDFTAHHDVYNALYYGLFTDTNEFSEMRHPLDRDLSEFMPVDWPLIKKLKNCALSKDELRIVSGALSASELVGNIGVLKAAPCDPNILGFASDIARQVDQFDCCVVYCHVQNGLKLSIRSTAREIMADELAAYLTQNTGSGGGNIEKAGAYLSGAAIQKAAPGIAPDDYLLERIRSYVNSYDMIYCDTHEIDFKNAPAYKKRRRPQGFARTADAFPKGASICVRTLEGDIDTVVSDDIYLMVGISGEIYPIRRDSFERDYEFIGALYVPVSEYPPTVIEKHSGEKKSLAPYICSCLPKREKLIRALELSRGVKVFSDWDREKYFLGRGGDYIAVPETDERDVFVINRDIFDKTYDRVN
jgi:phosphoglycolate phosphatase